MGFVVESFVRCEQSVDDVHVDLAKLDPTRLQVCDATSLRLLEFMRSNAQVVQVQFETQATRKAVKECAHCKRDDQSNCEHLDIKSEWHKHNIGPIPHRPVRILRTVCTEVAQYAMSAVYRHSLRSLCAVLALMVIFASPDRALGQDEQPQPTTDSKQPVSVSLESFGVQNTARPGDWCAIKLGLTLNTASAVLPVAVRIHVDDIDGDTALYERLVTLNAGISQSEWFYVPLPNRTRRGDVFAVTVHEVAEGGTTVGQQIAGSRISVADVVDRTEGLIGIIGRRTLGLDAYELSDNSGGKFPTSNESTTVLSGINPADIPDNWIGLSPFKLMLWSDSDPAQLSSSQASAITRWVERGGHLVIALPSLGQAWFDGANPLQELVPLVSATLLETMDYDRVRNLLTRRDEPYASMPLPRAPAWIFTPRDGTTPAEATVTIAGPEGGLIARRAVSAGIVTLIGVDLERRDVARALRAESFWHLLTGERFDIPTPGQLNDGASTGYRNRLRQAQTRSRAPIDEDIGRSVSRSATAGVGVLLALIVFISYWVIAGPAGYGLLRWRGLQRLSWPAFLFTTLVFALIAWIGARAISPGKTDAVQFDVMTSVYGTRGEHARSWVSLLLPSYGNREIEVRNDSDLDAIRTWAAPDDESALDFPDARGYVVDGSKLSAIDVPARGTVKQLRIDWLGASRWDGITLPNSERPPSLAARSGVWQASGLIENTYPDDLTDVQIVVSAGIRTETDRARDPIEAIGPLPYNAWVVSPPSGILARGQVFDLGSLQLSERAKLTEVFDSLNKARGGAIGQIDLNDGRGHERINWFGSIPPINYRAVSPSAREPRVHRIDVHGLDLSAWLVQPVIIVTGILQTESDDGPSQIRAPEEVNTQRTTLVRWICPLPGTPPTYNNIDRSSN